MDFEKKLSEKVDQFLQEEKMSLVEFKLFSKGRSTVLRVTVDYPQGGITMEDCARLNRKIFSYLDTEKILGEDFVVEVISPGVNRFLKKREDFLRVKGRKLAVWLITPFQGKDFWEGSLKRVEEDQIILENKDGIIFLPLDNIKTARQKIEG